MDTQALSTITRCLAIIRITRRLTTILSALQAIRDRGQEEWESRAKEDLHTPEMRKLDGELSKIETAIRHIGTAIEHLPRVV